jgi:hypothetical protein
MTEATASTALDQAVAPGVLSMVQGDKPWTIEKLADLLARPAAAPEVPPAPDPVEQVPLTEGLLGALRHLPEVFGRVSPTEARRLEAAEVKALTEEVSAIDAVNDEIGKRRTAVQEMIRVHQDHLAREAGLPVTVIESGKGKGHLLAAQPEKPFEVPVEGYQDAWQQRYVKGKAEPAGAVLLRLLADGKVTQAEYNGLTRSVRVLDHVKMAHWIRRHPLRGLQILAAITTRSAPTASLHAPKK